MDEQIGYHQFRNKGSWNKSDWTLLLASSPSLFTFFGVVISELTCLTDFRDTWSTWEFIWLFVFMLGIPFICLAIGVSKNPNICDRHGCVMDCQPNGVDGNIWWCNMCVAEQRKLLLDTEREARIEEIAEGYRRSQEFV